MRKLVVATLVASLLFAAIPSAALAGDRHSGSNLAAGVVLGATAAVVGGVLLNAFSTPAVMPSVVYAPAPPVVYAPPPPVVYAPAPPVVYTAPPVVYAPGRPVVVHRERAPKRHWEHRRYEPRRGWDRR